VGEIPDDLRDCIEAVTEIDSGLVKRSNRIVQKYIIYKVKFNKLA